MKYLITIFSFLLLTPNTFAYIISHEQLIQEIPSFRVNAQLGVNEETKNIQFYLENKTISENIGLANNLSTYLKRINPNTVYNFELLIEKQEKTKLNIINIRKSRTGVKDNFQYLAKNIREFQKLNEKREFFRSFLHGESGYETFIIRDLPFFAQAPLGTDENWSIHDESCEEAALLLNHYITQQIPFTAERMDRDIQVMNEYQKRNGISEDKYSKRFKKNFLRDLTDPNEMYNMLGKQYLGYRENQILMLQNPTIEDIELLIQNGNILTAPMKYTDTLRNKYIRAGKTFHILNIVGYDNENFYTQDPGTKNGAYLPYPKNLLFASIIENGNYAIALKKQ